MENKNTLIVIIIMCLISLRLSAQPPSWQVNENEFEYTMTMVAFLNVNATKLSDTNDMIGAFVGNECRGVANLIYAASTDNYFAYLTVFSNSTSENVTFKITILITTQLQLPIKRSHLKLTNIMGVLNQILVFQNLRQGILRKMY